MTDGHVVIGKPANHQVIAGVERAGRNKNPVDLRAPGLWASGNHYIREDRVAPQSVVVLCLREEDMCSNAERRSLLDRGNATDDARVSAKELIA